MPDSPLPSKRQKIFLNQPVVRTPSGTREKPVDPGQFTGRGMAETGSDYARTKMEVISRLGSSGPQDDPLINKLLSDQYRIDAMLGKGGMGAVYLAEDTSTGLPVALKVVVKENEKLIERFQRREAPALVELSRDRIENEEGRDSSDIEKAEERRKKSHIVRVLGFGIHEELTGVKYPYLVMEYLKGEDLKQRLEANGRFSVEMTRHVGIQICEALVEIHKKKIIHRDLKPANIFLIRQGDDSAFVKLLDFGLAKFEGADIKDSFLTSEGLPIMGTPHYQSPEQAFGKPLDETTDIFSLGIVLYEMLTGKLPFEGVSIPELSKKILDEVPTRMSSLFPDIPRELDDLIVNRVLHKNQAGRPSAQALMNALDTDSYRLSMDNTIGEDFQNFAGIRPSDPVKRDSKPVVDQNAVETQDDASQKMAPEKSGGAAKTVGKIVLVGAIVASAVYGYINRDKFSDITGIGRPASSVIASSSANLGPKASTQPPVQSQERSRKVIVTSEPKGAIVILLGKDNKGHRIGHTLNPLEIELPPGVQTVILRNPSFLDCKKDIPIDARSVSIKLSNDSKKECEMVVARETPKPAGSE